MSILVEKDENPFVIGQEDIDMEAPIFMSIDSDQEGDDDIDICSL